jgi:fibronectin-binding autotransporter adhesin
MLTSPITAILKRAFLALLTALSTAAACPAAVTINVGTYYLPAGVSTQIQIPVTSSTGTDHVPGCDFALQVNDGTTGPAVTSVGLTTGTIFALPGATQFTPTGNTNWVQFTNVVLDGRGGNPASAIVPTSGGILANVTVNTSGFTSGTFPLLLSGVQLALNLPSGFSTDFTDSGPTPTIVNGSITIVSTPANAYWGGTVDANWSTGSYTTGVTNWATDAGGATDTHAAPAASTDVFFTTTNAPTYLNSNLDADFSIKGLTFTSTSPSGVAINGNHTLTLGADGLTLQAGAASPTIGSAVTLGTSQTWTINGGNPLTVSGVMSLSGFTLTKSGTGTLRVNVAPNLAANSALVINAGTLRFAASGAATVGAGVTASIASGATLELAGSASALSSGANRATITNNSQQSSGGSLLVSGTNQQVGGIIGTGDTVVTAGASLTANSIVQNALVIGGAQGSMGSVTIALSDGSGNSLAESGGLASAGSITTSPEFASGTAGPFVADSSFDGGSALSTEALGGDSAGSFAVPEPSTLVLVAVACFGGLLLTRRRTELPS